MTQADASSKKAHKTWLVVGSPNGPVLLCSYHHQYGAGLLREDIGGCCPAHVEAIVEELNIRANEMLYNLGRIPRAEH